MNAQREKVLAVLASRSIDYILAEHPAAHTVDEMDQLHLERNDEIAKNLFVRDDKKNRYFLIVLRHDKKADLKNLRLQLRSRPLSFASEEDLREYLDLGKGSVTPFGILNDAACKVEVVFDRDLLDFERVGVHPNDNTATVWLRPQDLESVIRDHGNAISYIEI